MILKLRKKVEDNNSRMPTIKQIHFLLEHFNVDHEFRETENIGEYKTKGARYVNSRHTGKSGFEIIIRNPYIHLDTSCSYYSWNSYRYAEEILKLLEGKVESPTSQTSSKGDFSNEKEHNIDLKEVQK